MFLCINWSRTADKQELLQADPHSGTKRLRRVPRCQFSMVSPQSADCRLQTCAWAHLQSPVP
jgi:hypothetical protein